MLRLTYNTTLHNATQRNHKPKPSDAAPHKPLRHTDTSTVNTTMTTQSVYLSGLICKRKLCRATTPSWIPHSARRHKGPHHHIFMRRARRYTQYAAIYQGLRRGRRRTLLSMLGHCSWPGRVVESRMQPQQQIPNWGHHRLGLRHNQSELQTRRK